MNKPGATPESFAKRCWEVCRGTLLKVGEMKFLEDKVPLADIGRCAREFKRSRFLIVGSGREDTEQDFLGAKGIHVGFQELMSPYGNVDRDEARQWADRWSQQAERIVDTKPEWIEKAAAVYLATLELLEKHGTDTVTSNCLGGFASGRLAAYPCLGFGQMLDDGGLGVCEAMPDDTLSMLMARILTGRPGYVSDPALDTSRNQIVYAHCVGTTKVFGPKRPTNDYRIMLLHNRDPRGACARSLMPVPATNSVHIAP